MKQPTSTDKKQYLFSIKKKTWMINSSVRTGHGHIAQ